VRRVETRLPVAERQAERHVQKCHGGTLSRASKPDKRVRIRTDQALKKPT
jgi:uncharacterized C2H2 Zn-finger protein